MALLEKHFRNRFAARDGGYVFRQWGQEVAFTPAEVDGFIAERNRLWSHRTFAIYAAFGIAAPLWLAWKGWDSAAWAIAGTALIMLAVILVHGERLPNSVAETRVPAPSDTARFRSPRERAIWSLALGAAATALAIANWRRHETWSFWVWTFVAVAYGVVLLRYLYGQWQERRASRA